MTVAYFVTVAIDQSFLTNWHRQKSVTLHSDIVRLWQREQLNDNGSDGHNDSGSDSHNDSTHPMWWFI